MLNPVSDYLSGEELRFADRFFSSLAVTHDARKLDGFSKPTPIFFAIQFDGQIHFVIVPPDVEPEPSPVTPEPL